VTQTQEPRVATDEPLAQLRVRPANLHLFKGFGPFVAALILFVAMLLLAPSVAPERVVERAGDAPSTEPTLAPTTTVAPTAETTTTVAP
jgi:hypothetical protein